MRGFDEEKDKTSKYAGYINKAVNMLSKFCADKDTATSTCVVLSTASSVASLQIPSVTIQKILMTVKKIEKGVDKILKAPLKTALENFNFILDAVETGNFESAFAKLPILDEDAMKAFHYADGENGKISIESYKECSKATKLHMFAIILSESYDCDKKVFISSDKLSDNKVSLIGKALERIARKCIAQKDNVKTKSW